MSQIVYLSIVFPAIILIAYALHFVKNQKRKDWILVLLSLAPFLIEWTVVYREFLNNNGSTAGLSWIHLFPVYFCNFIMVLLIVLAAWPHKGSKVFNCLAVFIAWSAIFGGLITNLTTYFNGVAADFSHSVMLLAGLYIFIAGYAKLNVYNLVPYAFGLLFTGTVGATTRAIFVSKGFDVSGEMGNCMFMYAGVPGFEAINGYILAIIFLAIIFLITTIWEFFAKKKDDRWYKSINDLWLYLPKFAKRQKNIDAQNNDIENNDIEIKTKRQNK